MIDKPLIWKTISKKNPASIEQFFPGLQGDCVFAEGKVEVYTSSHDH